MRKLLINAADAARHLLKVDKGETNLEELLWDDQLVNEWKKGEPHARGMNILVMMATSIEARLKSENNERKYEEETQNTCTEEQVERCNKKDPRTPPGNWSDLKYLVTTYAIILCVCFTKKCPHFKNVWMLCETLVAIMKNREKYFTLAAHAVPSYGTSSRMPDNFSPLN